MGDMGEMWKDLKKIQQKKRSNNRIGGAELLNEAGIKFETKNAGAHLIVQGNDELIDFWPGTGRWMVRRGKTGFGVNNLIKLIEKQKVD